MRHIKRVQCLTLVALLAVYLAGCQGVVKRKSKPKRYAVPMVEAEWIRKGEPIEFEGEQWFPRDSAEYLLDREVYLLGIYRGVEFFVEKLDVRPYERLYTKFGRHKFRSFKKKN